MLVDVDAHHSPAAYSEVMGRVADADVQKRLELMDEAGVEVQVLSHGHYGAIRASETGAFEAARACNDGYADLRHKHPLR